MRIRNPEERRSYAAADSLRSGTKAAVRSRSGSAQATPLLLPHYGRIYRQPRSRHGSDYPERPEDGTGGYADVGHRASVDDGLRPGQVGSDRNRRAKKKTGTDQSRILVLDHGKVVEFGTPWELIQANGSFRDLVKQSGEENTLIDVRAPFAKISHFKLIW